MSIFRSLKIIIHLSLEPLECNLRPVCGVVSGNKLNLLVSLIGVYLCNLIVINNRQSHEIKWVCSTKTFSNFGGFHICIDCTCTHCTHTHIHTHTHKELLNSLCRCIHDLA